MYPCLLLLALGAEPATDWPALVQKPYAGLPVADLGLKPLLVAADGKKIATKDEWEKARQRLHDAWMERLQRGGVAVLLAMMSIALFNDVSRLFG